MKPHTRPFRIVPLALGLIGLATGPAFAQSDQNPAPATTTLESEVQTPQGPIGQLPAAIERPYWSTSSGFEGDTHGTGYGFIGPTYHRPVNDNVTVLFGAGLNYLYYEFANGNGGETRVNSPGAEVEAGVRVGGRNWVQFTAGPSFKRRHRTIRDDAGQVLSSETDLDPGFSLGSHVWINPARTNNIHGMFSYGTEDRYAWGRLGFKQQVSNFNWNNRFTHYLGVEYIGQGNDDIRSNQYGGFVEFLHAPSSISLMLRGGYKASSFQAGPEKTGPWYAVSFYRSFR